MKLFRGGGGGFSCLHMYSQLDEKPGKWVVALLFIVEVLAEAISAATARL